MRDIDIQVVFPRTVFVRLVTMLEEKKEDTEGYLQSEHFSDEQKERYGRELKDVKSMLSCLLEEDADEYDEPV